MKTFSWDSIRWRSPLAMLLLLTLAAAPAGAAPGDLAEVTVGGGQMQVDPTGEYAVLRLRMQGSEGWARDFDLAGVGLQTIDLAGLADGAYTFELRPVVAVSEEVFAAARRARDDGDAAALGALRAQGKLPAPAAPQFGSFRIAAGLVVEAEGAGEAEALGALPAARAAAEPTLARRDQLFIDDVIVTANLCVGSSCVNGETFGNDKLRLKAVNTRIHFDDTSTGPGYPANDWRLTANDSTSGGLNRFSIDDATANRSLLTLQAGAPEHSIYVDSQGNVGFNTNAPAKALHIIRGDTPTIRLEQDGSQGFLPQTWEVAGNETNFFVRNFTTGEIIPFKIRPGAPTNSLYVQNNGNLGVTNGDPQAALHVLRSDNTALLRVEDTGNAAQDLMQLVNNGVARFRLIAADSGNDWQFRVGASSFNVSRDSTGGNEFEIANDGTVRMGPGAATVFTLATNGNLTISGVLNSASDRNVKRDIAPVERDVLARVRQLPLATWRYKEDATDALHLGPMAQDFAALFGLGADDRHLAPQDLAGVALAAIQELHDELEAKQDRLRSLEEQNAELAKRLEALEAQLQP